MLSVIESLLKLLMSLKSLADLLFKLSNKSFKVSKNRAVCFEDCIPLVFMLTVMFMLTKCAETLLLET